MTDTILLILILLGLVLNYGAVCRTVHQGSETEDTVKALMALLAAKFREEAKDDKQD